MAGLVPGQRLTETVLCETYGVSRTVVREALRQLESERLITVLPNLGPIVTFSRIPRSARSTPSARRSKGWPESSSLRPRARRTARALLKLKDRLDAEYRKGDMRAAKRSRLEFYTLLLKGAGNEVLTEQLHSIHARIAMFRRFAFVNGARIEPSIRELEAIIDAAAKKRDPAAAWAACEHHMVISADLAIMEYARIGRALAS